MKEGQLQINMLLLCAQSANFSFCSPPHLLSVHSAMAPFTVSGIENKIMRDGILEKKTIVHTTKMKFFFAAMSRIRAREKKSTTKK